MVVVADDLDPVRRKVDLAAERVGHADQLLEAVAADRAALLVVDPVAVVQVDLDALREGPARQPEALREAALVRALQRVLVRPIGEVLDVALQRRRSGHSC